MAAVKRQHADPRLGENKVSPHLHLPVHKEELAIIAFRGHLLVVIGTAALSFDQPRRLVLVMLCTAAMP